MPNHYVISQRLTVLLIVIIVSDYTIFSVPMVSCKNKSIIELSDITALLSFLLEKKKTLKSCAWVSENTYGLMDENLAGKQRLSSRHMMFLKRVMEYRGARVTQASFIMTRLTTQAYWILG